METGIRIFFVVALSLLSGHAFSDQEWSPIFDGDNGLKYEIKNGSLELRTTTGGDEVYVVTGRVIQMTPSKIDFEKWYVERSSCEAGEGNLVTLTLSGDFQYENPFIFKGGNVASGIAELICGAAVYRANINESKGL